MPPSNVAGVRRFALASLVGFLTLGFQACSGTEHSTGKGPDGADSGGEGGFPSASGTSGTTGGQAGSDNTPGVAGERPGDAGAGGVGIELPAPWTGMGARSAGTLRGQKYVLHVRIGAPEPLSLSGNKFRLNLAIRSETGGKP